MVAIIAPFSQRRRSVMHELAELILLLDRLIHEAEPFAETERQRNALKALCKAQLDVTIEFGMGGR